MKAGHKAASKGDGRSHRTGRYDVDETREKASRQHESGEQAREQPAKGARIGIDRLTSSTSTFPLAEARLRSPAPLPAPCTMRGDAPDSTICRKASIQRTRQRQQVSGEDSTCNAHDDQHQRHQRQQQQRRERRMLVASNPQHSPPSTRNGNKKPRHHNAQQARHHNRDLCGSAKHSCSK